MPVLRAVGPDDLPQKRKSVSEAAASGDRRELLVALRERISRAISKETCADRDLAALTRRLQEIATELDHIDASGDGENSVVANTNDEPFDTTSV